MTNPEQVQNNYRRIFTQSGNRGRSDSRGRRTRGANNES